MSKYLCIHAAQVGGHIYDRGDVVELTDEQYEKAKVSFNPVKDENTETTALPPKPLTLEQYRAKLDDLHISYTKRASKEELAKLLKDATEGK